MKDTGRKKFNLFILIFFDISDAKYRLRIE